MLYAYLIENKREDGLYCQALKHDFLFFHAIINTLDNFLLQQNKMSGDRIEGINPGRNNQEFLRLTPSVCPQKLFSAKFLILYSICRCSFSGPRLPQQRAAYCSLYQPKRLIKEINIFLLQGINKIPYFDQSMIQGT